MRSVPHSQRLLEGMLQADIVGFHTFGYSRYFLSCCTRMLGLETVSETPPTDKHAPPNWQKGPAQLAKRPRPTDKHAPPPARPL
eukprot:COSAG01_NODE_8866_length_2631_cov_129.957741_4_plen_84_part_00